MKELCIQVCPRARLMIEVTEEMERDFYDCWDMAKHIKEFKDCDSCSWKRSEYYFMGHSILRNVEERCSREGRII